MNCHIELVLISVYGWINKNRNKCSDMKDYEFLKEEFKKLIELDSTIEFAYWIRLHSIAEHLISQI